MRVDSAGRQIDRAGTKYKLTSKYIIYDKPCMYIMDERQVGGSAGRHIHRPRAEYRSTSIYIINNDMNVYSG